jgi:succinate dehydrogenase / fumarate reductase, cytochrome b subunit
MKQTTPSRPLSPHLQIYRPQMTSVLSIFHRMAGAFLSIGLLLVVCILVAAATGPEPYARVMQFINKPIGQIILFGWTAALYFHLFNGIRHLIWDTGRLFKIEHATLAGFVVILSAAGATAFTWFSIVGGL